MRLRRAVAQVPRRGRQLCIEHVMQPQNGHVMCTKTKRAPMATVTRQMRIQYKF